MDPTNGDRALKIVIIEKRYLEKDENKDENISNVAKEGKLYTRQVEGPGVGLKRLIAPFLFKLKQGVARFEAIILNHRQTYLLEHKINQISKSFEKLIELNNRHNYLLEALIEPF